MRDTLFTEELFFSYGCCHLMIVALFCYIIIFIMNVPAAFTADRIPAIDSQGILFLYCSYFVYYFLPAFGYFSPYFGARPF